MSAIYRVAGLNGSFDYVLTTAPASAPVLTIYSDPARTQVAVASATLVATPDPRRYRAAYPSTLAAGTWYLRFSTVLVTGNPPLVDDNDVLVLAATSPLDPVGPCQPWTTEDAVRCCCPTLGASVDVEASIAAASEILWRISGEQFGGECAQVLRPCPPCRCAGCSGGCGCAVPRIKLADPVVAVAEVLVDGAALSRAEYAVADDRWLVRMADADGHNPGWGCQRLDLAPSEPGTIQVSYAFGRQPPESGKLAAAELACQIALACDPSTVGQCRLPPHVSSITRQGVSLAFIQTTIDVFSKGYTGLPLTDLFIAAVNPNGLRQRARVHSPDLVPGARFS